MDIETRPVKIAYCILCHKYTPVLEALIGWLEGTCDFYLHVDAKADLAPFAPLRERPRVYFVEERVAVHWGDITLTEAYLAVLRASRAGPYDYIAVLSGDTLPLRPKEQIEAYLLSQGLDREHIVEDGSGPQVEAQVKYRYPMQSVPRQASLWFRLIWRLRRQGHLFPRNPRYRDLPAIGKGPAWFVITPAFRDYVLDYIASHPGYLAAFREAYASDELVFHTLLRHSPFREKSSPRPVMYVDWYTGPTRPRTLDESDFGRLRAARALDDGQHHYLFARKFSDRIDLEAYRSQVFTEGAGETDLKPYRL